MLLEGARQVLDEADDLDSRIRLGGESLSGLIRISAPMDLGLTRVKPVIDRFLEENPKITIDLVLSDGYMNIVDEGIDIAVRYGSLADSSLRSRTLGKNQRVACASPEYIQRYGVPQTPQALAEHNCLLMRFGRHLDNVWVFREGAQEWPVKVKGNRIANDSRLIHDWGLQGYGIMLRSLWDVGKDIQTGRLVTLLEEYSPLATSVQMLFPPSRTQPRRVAMFTQQLVGAFADE
jgi:DNA-binding transcriptional LysR family regulator